MKINGPAFWIIGGSQDKQESTRRWHKLSRLGFKTDMGDGCYMGKKEYCIVVWREFDGDEQVLCDIGIEWDEDTILHVDANRVAYIIDCASKELTRIGTWRSIGPEAPLPTTNSWTKLNGKYYVAS